MGAEELLKEVQLKRVVKVGSKQKEASGMCMETAELLEGVQQKMGGEKRQQKKDGESRQQLKVSKQNGSSRTTERSAAENKW